MVRRLGSLSVGGFVAHPDAPGKCSGCLELGSVAVVGPTDAWHTDGVKHLPDVGRIAALSSGDKDRQWEAMPVYAKMDFASDAAA